MGATEYGKILRKIRIENNEVLKNMVDKLALHDYSITISYLSAIENGLRSIPSELSSKIIEIYKLDEKQIKELKNAAKFSQKKAVIELSNLTNSYRDTALLFARQFNDIPDSDMEKIRNILKKKGEIDDNI